MPSPSIPRAARRFIDRHGESATLTHYSDDGSRDEYGDPSFTTTTVNVQAVFRAPAELDNSRRRDDAGERPQIQAEMWLRSDVSVYDTEDRVKPTTIEQDATGDVWKIVLKRDEGNGLTKAVGEEVK